ncbi:MAG: poly(R)-hydroxyalkanoic acid synthase subunit PhaE [Novosphingobium sp.]
MTKPTAFDPVATWQDMVQKWEHEINSWSGKFTESEQFSAVMGQATKASLYAQKAMAEHMESVLRSLNLPSKTQVEELAERLDAIEESIERLRLALEPGARIPEPESPRPSPRRSRKPGA